MAIHSILTRLDFENYLIRLYFGSETDLLKACLDRAYLDFNRTLHGIHKIENSSELYNRAVILLKDEFDQLKLLLGKPISPAAFDEWHKNTLKELVSLYKSYHFHLFVGQSQKWINMSLKYIFTLGEQRIPGFQQAYPYCHVPFDNIILNQLTKYGFPSPDCPWSRLDNYDDYFNSQKWIRQRFSIFPMDVEFLLWSGKEIDP